jgi:DNA-binding NarL/FixJ family response regulator
MASNKQDDLLISATGTWRTMPDPAEAKRERSTLPGALGINNQTTLDSVLQAIHRAAKSNESSVLGLGRGGEATNEVLRVRPAREEGFAVVSVERIDSQPEPLDYRLLMKLFELTQTEAQVAVALMLSEDLRAIAEERHSSLETVRMHVKRILRKTGMTSQKRLTALLATLGMLAASSGRAVPRK